MQNNVPLSDYDIDLEAMEHHRAYPQCPFPFVPPNRSDVSDEDSDRSSNNRYASRSVYDLSPPASLLVEIPVDEDESLTGNAMLDRACGFIDNCVNMYDLLMPERPRAILEAIVDRVWAFWCGGSDREGFLV
ncbi:hypothetical protein CaCOL14_013180 [Colletotrichum acutatum]